MFTNTQNRFRMALMGTFLCITSTTLSADVQGDETNLQEKVNFLTEELIALRQSVSDLNAEKDANLLVQADKKAAPAEAPKAATVDNSCCPPKPTYPKPQFAVHGFVRLDGVVMDRIPLGNLIQPVAFQVPFNYQSDRRHYQTILDARYSRFGVDGAYEVCNTKVKGLIEVDFWTADGNDLVTHNRHIRLRHAYVRADFANNWYLLLGQTWGIVTSTEIAWPFFYMCDFVGPAGMSYSRQPQVKLGYVRKLDNCKGEIEYAVNIEQQSVFTTQTGGVNANIALAPAQGEPSRFPLLGGSITWKKWEPLQVDLRAGISENRFAILNTRQTTSRVSNFVKVSAQSKIWKPTFYGSYMYLNGMSRFGFVPFFDSVITANLHIKNVKAHGAFAGFTYPLQCDIFLNVIAGKYWAHEINGTAFSGSTFYKEMASGQIALSRKFWGSYFVCAEYKRWNVKSLANNKGHMNLYMTTFAFLF